MTSGEMPELAELVAAYGSARLRTTSNNCLTQESVDRDIAREVDAYVAIQNWVTAKVEEERNSADQFRDDVFLLAHRIRRNKNPDLVAHIIRLCEERGAKAQILRGHVDHGVTSALSSPSLPAGGETHE